MSQEFLLRILRAEGDVEKMEREELQPARQATLSEYLKNHQDRLQIITRGPRKAA